MDLNGLELAILLVWVIGIGAIVHTGRRSGFASRTWIALAAAVVVPVAGSLLAITYATVARGDRTPDPKQTFGQWFRTRPYPSRERPARFAAL